MIDRPVVTILRSKITHDQSETRAQRTRCNKVWTDECVPGTPLTCRECKAIRQKLDR